LALIWPQHGPDPAHGLAGQRVRRVGVDPGHAALRVIQDALDHAHVHVLLAGQRPGGVPRVVQPGGLRNTRLGKKRLLLVPVVVRAEWFASACTSPKICIILPRSF
jgi:hypothetical protein